MQILVAHYDDLMISYIIALRHSGYQVIEVTDAAHAMLELQSGKTDLLIVTSALPPGDYDPTPNVPHDTDRGVALLQLLGTANPPPVTHAILMETCGLHFCSDSDRLSSEIGIAITVVESPITIEALLIIVDAIQKEQRAGKYASTER